MGGWTGVGKDGISWDGRITARAFTVDQIKANKIHVDSTLTIGDEDFLIWLQGSTSIIQFDSKDRLAFDRVGDELRIIYNNTGEYSFTPTAFNAENNIIVTTGALTGGVITALTTLQVNGANFNVIANGNVGVGLTNPSVELQVVGRFKVGTTGAQYQFARDGGTGFLTIQGNQAGFTGLDWKNQGGTTTFTILDNGDVGIGTTSTLALDVRAKGGITAEGGHTIKLTNKTGAIAVAGDVVRSDPANDNSASFALLEGFMPIGVIYESGAAADAEVWIVTGGIVGVHMDSNGCATGDRITTSDITLGRGRVNNNPSIAVHFSEIGHALETVGANGTAKCVVHFN